VNWKEWPLGEEEFHFNQISKGVTPIKLTGVGTQWGKANSETFLFSPVPLK
jgi:hypothetical protein